MHPVVLRRFAVLVFKRDEQLILLSVFSIKTEREIYVRKKNSEIISSKLEDVYCEVASDFIDLKLLGVNFLVRIVRMAILFKIVRPAIFAD